MKILTESEIISDFKLYKFSVIEYNISRRNSFKMDFYCAKALHVMQLIFCKCKNGL
jgi:hypothetical protein